MIPEKGRGTASPFFAREKPEIMNRRRSKCYGYVSKTIARGRQSMIE
jgi:hypothetical protein